MTRTVISRRSLTELQRILERKERKEKTSVSLAGEIVRAVDAVAGTARRSAFIERAVRRYLRSLLHRAPERVVEVTWGSQRAAVYPVELLVMAQDRPGLLRDISELYAREKLNVIGVNSSSTHGEARMLFTVEIQNAADVSRVLTAVREIKDVFSARRR